MKPMNPGMIGAPAAVMTLLKTALLSGAIIATAPGASWHKIRYRRRELRPT